MKVLIDSNVVLEAILQRERVEVANKCLLTLAQGRHELYLTAGGFYGMLYTIDKYLRKVIELKKPVRVAALRSIMIQVLNQYQVADHDRKSLLSGIEDNLFTDLEDSCQYQAAIKSGCELLLTFNIADYPTNADAGVKVLSPEEYLVRQGEKK